MEYKKLKRFIVFTLLAAAVIPALQKDGFCLIEDKYEFRESQKLHDFVCDAVALIEEKGEQAFFEFNKRNSKWRKGTYYVMAFDANGTIFVWPNDINLMSKNVADIKDKNGRPVFLWALESLSGSRKQSEWIRYSWAEKGDVFPFTKTSFFKKAYPPSGKVYVVGAGQFNMKIEKQFITYISREIKALIEKKGHKKAFTIIHDPLGKFAYDDIFITIISKNSRILLDTAHPEREGQDIHKWKDMKGSYPYPNILDNIKAGENIWVEIADKRPGTNAPYLKNSYIRKDVINNGIYFIEVSFAK